MQQTVLENDRLGLIIFKRGREIVLLKQDYSQLTPMLISISATISLIDYHDSLKDTIIDVASQFHDKSMEIVTKPEKIISYLLKRNQKAIVNFDKQTVDLSDLIWTQSPEEAVIIINSFDDNLTDDSDRYTEALFETPKQFNFSNLSFEDTLDITTNITKRQRERKNTASIIDFINDNNHVVFLN